MQPDSALVVSSFISTSFYPIFPFVGSLIWLWHRKRAEVAASTQHRSEARRIILNIVSRLPGESEVTYEGIWTESSAIIRARRPFARDGSVRGLRDPDNAGGEERRFCGFAAMDPIWAHIQGYPPWPGLVIDPADKQLPKEVTRSRPRSKKVCIALSGATAITNSSTAFAGRRKERRGACAFFW